MFFLISTRYLTYSIPSAFIQAVETALALWVAMQNSVSQRYDAKGLAQFWGPDV